MISHWLHCSLSILPSFSHFSFLLSPLPFCAGLCPVFVLCMLTSYFLFSVLWPVCWLFKHHLILFEAKFVVFLLNPFYFSSPLYCLLMHLSIHFLSFPCCSLLFPHILNYLTVWSYGQPCCVSQSCALSCLVCIG